MRGAHKAHKLTSWSVMTYSLIVHAYPHAFRQEFGDSMIQVFSDSVRDAWRENGLAGLTRLWGRTFVDVARSLVRAYECERQDWMGRAACSLTILYLIVLAGIVAYAAVAFGEFYRPPGFSVFGAFQAREDTLIAAYQQAIAGEFGTYRRFTSVAGVSLAVFLGATTALIGLWQRSLATGAGALVTGIILTVAAFELLPTVWFPFDRYPVGALWLMGGGAPLAVCTWILVMMLGPSPGMRAHLKHS